MQLRITLDDEASAALIEAVKHRENHTSYLNTDPNFLASMLLRLGILAHKSDCWGHASACLTDRGEISLHG